jgi:hypothetical protein
VNEKLVYTWFGFQYLDSEFDTQDGTPEFLNCEIVITVGPCRDGKLKMPDTKEKSCLSDLGGLIQVFAGILVLGAQITIYLTLVPFFASIPLYPPDIRPLYDVIAQMMIIIIIVMGISGSVIIVGGIVSFFRSGGIGGFLSLFFGVAVIAGGIWMLLVVAFYPGIVHFVGAILAIVGGILSIIPGIKGPPKPKSRREKDRASRLKKKK